MLRGTLGNPLVHPAGEIVARAVELVAAFRASGLPIVFASVNGTPGGRNNFGGTARQYPPEFTELTPELEPRPADLLDSCQLERIRGDGSRFPSAEGLL